MNSQQLQEARHALWHHDGKPLTTLDEAQSWLNSVGICLWLPRGSQFAAPMPSFVEACAGVASATPSPEAIAHATDLLARLTEAGTAVPLNLLGTNLGVEGERADFVVAPSALSYVYALRGAKPWKAAPPIGGPGRVSTLSLRVWEGLQVHEAAELSELRESVGHDVSDAGVLRALGELWSSLRAFPIPQIEGKPARWQLLSRRFSKQLNAGSSMGQAAALSALISLYLDSVIAASTEEIEAALSPLVARSRISEVVRALEANRQIEFTAVGGALLMHFSDVEDHLPPPIEIVLPPAAPFIADATASSGPKKYIPRERSERPARPARPAEGGRTFPTRERRAASASGDRGPRKPFGDRSQFKPRQAGGEEKRSPFGATRSGPPRERAPFKPRSADGTSAPRKPFGGPRSASSGSPRSGPPRERAPFKPRVSGGEGAPRRSFGARPGSDRPGSDRPPREGAPYKPRSAGSSAPRKPFSAARGPAGPPRERAPFKPRGGDAPQRRSFAGPGGRPSGPPRERSSFAGASRRPSTGAPKRFGDARPPREGGDRKPFSREGRPPASRPRPEGGRPSGERKAFGAKTGGFSKPGGYGKTGGFSKSGGFSKPAGKFSGKPRSTFGAARPPRAESSERPSRDTAERRPWQNRPTGAGGASKTSRPAGDRPAGKSFGAKKPSFGKSSGKPYSDRPRSSTPRGESSGPRPGGFGKRPGGGGFKKSSGPSAGPRKPGGFSRGPGGPKRSGGSSRPGGFGKRPGGSGSRPGGGKPRS